MLSIENQSYKNLEIWIIDGNSTDGTQSYLKSLKAPFNWISENDGGIYDAMNKGISLSNGRWLLFLGSDDKIYTNDTLESIFCKPIASKTRLIIGKIQFNWKRTDSYFIKKNDGVKTPSWSKKLWIKNTLPHQGIFYNRNVFDNMTYDLKYTVLADYALNLKLYKAKVQIKIVNNIIAICNTGGISKKYNLKLYKEEVNLKTEESSIIFRPIFILISSMKYLIKKLKF